MSEQLVVGYSSVALAAGLCSIVIAIYAFRHRGVPAAIPLSITMLGSSIWAFAGVGMRLPVSATGIRTAHLLQYVGITLLIAGVFTFALAYTGREAYLNRRVGALLAVEPTLLYIVLLTNEWHGLFFRSLTVIGGVEAIATEYGPAAAVHLAYSYGLLLVSIGLLFQLLFRSRSVYLGQTLMVLVAICVPLVGNAVFLLELIAVDLAPVALAGSGALLSVAIYRYQFVEVLPIARDTVVENIEDPVVVLDRNDRIVDLNPAARRAFGIDPEQPVLGVAAAELLPDAVRAVLGASGAVKPDDSSTDLTGVGIGEAVDHVEQSADRAAVTNDGGPRSVEDDLIDLDTPRGTRHYDPQITLLSGDRGRSIGRLALFRDVTRQHHQQVALQEQNEQLDQFASVVSHDLRNPLTVAQGYAELIDHEHADEVVVSLDRMEAIIDDVLALARQGQAVEDPRPVDLETVARSAWSSVDTEGGSLAVSETARFVADESRLRRLFENLFRNAVEHAGDDTAPAVRVGPLYEGAPGFFVEDDGPGIPKQQRDEVLKAGVSGGDDGTGLGLSIVNGIAQAHGWSLSLTESEGGGARFEFRGIERDSA